MVTGSCAQSSHATRQLCCSELRVCDLVDPRTKTRLCCRTIRVFLESNDVGVAEAVEQDRPCRFWSESQRAERAKFRRLPIAVKMWPRPVELKRTLPQTVPQIVRQGVSALPRCAQQRFGRSAECLMDVSFTRSENRHGHRISAIEVRYWIARRIHVAPIAWAKSRRAGSTEQVESDDFGSRSVCVRRPHDGYSSSPGGHVCDQKCVQSFSRRPRSGGACSERNSRDHLHRAICDVKMSARNTIRSSLVIGRKSRFG